MTEERSENAVFAVDIGLRFDRTLGSREEIKLLQDIQRLASRNRAFLDVSVTMRSLNVPAQGGGYGYPPLTVLGETQTQS